MVSSWGLPSNDGCFLPHANNTTFFGKMKNNVVRSPTIAKTQKKKKTKGKEGT
jgi:hypothetical protein